MQSEYGHIVVLNGASGAGKTSLAQALLPRLNKPFMYHSFDKFSEEFCLRWILSDSSIAEFTQEQAVRGYYVSVADLANQGQNIIADHVIIGEKGTRDLVDILNGYSALLIGVYCDPDVLGVRAEFPDIARLQAGYVHQRMIYDFTVDTTATGVSKCARRIAKYVNNITPSDIKPLRDKVNLDFDFRQQSFERYQRYLL